MKKDTVPPFNTLQKKGPFPQAPKRSKKKLGSQPENGRLCWSRCKKVLISEIRQRGEIALEALVGYGELGPNINYYDKQSHVLK